MLHDPDAAEPEQHSSPPLPPGRGGGRGGSRELEGGQGRERERRGSRGSERWKERRGEVGEISGSHSSLALEGMGRIDLSKKCR